MRLMWTDVYDIAIELSRSAPGCRPEICEFCGAEKLGDGVGRI